MATRYAILPSPGLLLLVTHKKEEELESMGRNQHLEGELDRRRYKGYIIHSP